MTRALVARLDNMGDLIMSGPAIRAITARARVTVLCSPGNREAAHLLPGVDSVITWDAPWTGFDPPPVEGISTLRLVSRIRAERIDAAAVLTSFHQSPLPLALLLRLAGVGEIAAVGVDYPGSLLDHRVPYDENLHEVEQNLAVAEALGFPLEGEARLHLNATSPSPIAPPYVVVHPGASVPARGLPSRLIAEAVEALVSAGHRVVLTGTARDRTIPIPALDGVDDLRGRTRLGELVAVISEADALIAGNTGPAHVAAATSTPVVSVFAPVVPFHRWEPWKVPVIPLGDQHVECAGCRARTCPLPEQVCISDISGRQVLAAVEELVDAREVRTVTT